MLKLQNGPKILIKEKAGYYLPQRFLSISQKLTRTHIWIIWRPFYPLFRVSKKGIITTRIQPLGKNLFSGNLRLPPAAEAAVDRIIKTFCSSCDRCWLVSWFYLSKKQLFAIIIMIMMIKMKASFYCDWCDAETS